MTEHSDEHIKISIVFPQTEAVTIDKFNDLNEKQGDNSLIDRFMTFNFV